MTMVLCEQNTSLVDRAATRVAVIEKGRLVLEHAGGAPDYRRYLGVA
jgi:ABC-type branched-subunit amino acid transport system ATPase component